MEALNLLWAVEGGCLFAKSVAFVLKWLHKWSGPSAVFVVLALELVEDTDCFPEVVACVLEDNGVSCERWRLGSSC